MLRVRSLTCSLSPPNNNNHRSIINHFSIFVFILIAFSFVNLRTSLPSPEIKLKGREKKTVERWSALSKLRGLSVEKFINEFDGWTLGSMRVCMHDTSSGLKVRRFSFFLVFSFWFLFSEKFPLSRSYHLSPTHSTDTVLVFRVGSRRQRSVVNHDCIAIPHSIEFWMKTAKSKSC